MCGGRGRMRPGPRQLRPFQKQAQLARFAAVRRAPADAAGRNGAASSDLLASVPRARPRDGTRARSSLVLRAILSRARRAKRPHPGPDVGLGRARNRAMSRLARNFVYNLAGVGLPLVFAVAAVPLLARFAGLPRLGFLTIAWALIGYLGFLDLGLSRVVARRMAAAASDAHLADEVRLMRRLVVVLGVGGAAAAGLLALLTPDRWLAREHLPAELVDEVRLAWVLLVATLPLLLVSNIWRGAMEGRQAFAQVNLYRLAFGVWTYGAPLLVVTWQPSLPAMIGIIVAGRVALAWLHWRWCDRHLPSPNGRLATIGAAVSGPALGGALREGGWITLSNAVSPLMVVADRLVLGTFLPLAAVAAYAVPQEIALRLLIVPAALAITVFPAVASLAGAGAPAAGLVRRAMRVALAVTLPFAFVLALLAEPILALWMGAAFAAESAVVLKLLMVGIVVNAPAQIVFASLQATARARTTALLHVGELLPYAALLLVAGSAFGVVGAALAWSVRVIVDALILFLLARADDRSAVDRRFVGGTLLALSAVALGGWAHFLDWPVTAAMIAVAAAAAALAALLDRDDRSALLGLLPWTRQP